ncbi:MAG TPA: isochorismatase family protein [Caulobacteraceae bacterium]|nr:isochorismatase family protein [Caulobacteraceae bacterium]
MSEPRDVVIVIDLQTGMLDGVAEPPLHDADALVERVREVLAWARRTGRKVAFIRHDGDANDSLAPGKPGWPVWPALGQAADEPTFSKTVGDSFSNPALGDWVDGAGADRVILLGAQTDMCVAATVQGALSRGLSVTVVGDSNSTVAWGAETAPQIIDRHNRQFETAGAQVVTAAELIA